MNWSAKNVLVFTSVLILLLGTFAIGSPDGSANRQKKTSVTITNGDLSVLFRDNSASPEILSGIQSLFNTKAASNYDAYDPSAKGASAGMNFEHIISGHRSQSNKFTPRHGKYDLFQLPDKRALTN